AGAQLGSFSIGPVTPADRNDETELLARSATALIPKGTRTIVVTMSASGGTGDNQYNTAFADNLSLTVTTNALHFPTVPVTLPKR
ncbi:MAG TPA: hypothetical protein VK425_02210, partial [Acidimicrobiales bacterium]|nr:hypothetical protein [Acidimicrobiales bacterium]